MIVTPDGAPAELNVTALTATEMAHIAAVVDIFERHGIMPVCCKCFRPFHGRNAATDRTWAMNCECRELRADMGRGRV